MINGIPDLNVVRQSYPFKRIKGKEDKFIDRGPPSSPIFYHIKIIIDRNQYASPYSIH